jgi:signal peptidase II
MRPDRGRPGGQLLTIGDWAVFPYIFNVADIAISTSIIVLLVFHRKIMPVEEPVPSEDETVEEEPDMVSESTDPGKRDLL